MKRRSYVWATLIILALAITLAWGGIFSGSKVSNIPKSEVSTPPAIKNQQSATNVSEESFTGKAIKAAEAVKLADTIVVGRLIDPGTPQPDAPGEIYYENAKIEVIRTLKGNKSEQLTVSFSVQKISSTGAEKAPEKGEQYLFFIKSRGPRALKGIKILRATEDNLNAVSKLVDSN
jgi:hypothetical protein